MFWVMTASSSPRRSSSASAAWAGFGCLSASIVESRPVEVPEPLRVAMEGVDRRDRHRIDLLPQPLAGSAEVGDPGRNRDPGPGERHRAPALADELRQLLRGRARGLASVGRHQRSRLGKATSVPRGVGALAWRTSAARTRGRCAAGMRSVRQGSGPDGPPAATSRTTSACACRGRPRCPRARPRSRTRSRSRPSRPRSPRPGRPSPRRS